MSAIIPEEFNIASSFLFKDTVSNNPFGLRRSQILVARIPPLRAQRAVGAQCILDLILRKIISHLRREMLLNLIVLPIFRSYGAYGRRSLLHMLILVIMILSPLFDVGNNYFAYLPGSMNDFNALGESGSNSISHLIGISFFMAAALITMRILIRCKNYPEHYNK